MDFEAYLRAINAHDWDGLVGFMTEDVVYEDITVGQRHHGKPAVVGFWSGATRTVSTDFQMERLRSFATDTDYAYEWIFRGTHDAPEAHPPATGRKFAIHGVSIGRLEGGLIKENKDVWNMVEFLGQIGAMPAPARAGSG